MSFNSHITETALALSKRLGIKANDLGRILGYWARKSPPGTFEDMVQEISIAWMEQEPASPQIAFGIGRHIVNERWKRVYTVKQKTGVSLDTVLDDETGKSQADFIVDGVDYETLVCGAITCSEIFNRLPDWMQELVAKRLNGKPVNGQQANMMKAWALGNTGVLTA